MVHEFINELEKDYRKYYGEILCINPDWTSKEGEVLFPQKMMMFHIARLFNCLRTLLPDEKLSEEQGHALWRLMSSMQGMISETSFESSYEGRDEVYQLVRDGVKDGNLVTSDEIENMIKQKQKTDPRNRTNWDEQNLFKKAFQLWKDERAKGKSITFIQSLEMANEMYSILSLEIFDLRKDNIVRNYGNYRVRENGI